MPDLVVHGPQPSWRGGGLPRRRVDAGVILGDERGTCKITAEADAIREWETYLARMATWNATRTVMGSPDEVISALTDPAAARRWSPIGFELEDFDGERLEAGSQARLVGRLAGREVAFDVDVLEVGDGLLSLTATGPVHMDVRYDAVDLGDATEVLASVDVRSGGGLLGRVLSSATDAVLAGGALQAAIAAVAREVEGSSQLEAAA